jgi:death-on-curing protein
VTGAKSNPAFVSIDEVLLLHTLAIREFGGSGGIRDIRLLESALYQPQASFAGRLLHDRPFEMAAVYAFHLCQNHPFVDGNKRTAWAAMRTFLFQEGYLLRVPLEMAVHTMLELAAGRLSKQELADWVSNHVTRRPTMELRDFFLSLTFEELSNKLVAIAQSYQSGGPGELTAIVNEASGPMPALAALAHVYEFNRDGNEQVIHYIQLLCALHRIAEEKGYEW